MMHGWVRRLSRANYLRKIEAVVDQLSVSVVSVVLAGRISGNAIAVARPGDTLDRLENRFASEIAEIKQGSKESVEICVMGEKPQITPYFSGREKELGLLKKKLEEYGSAAIMEFGGSGKTQLMTTFAHRAEKNEWVPGRCFWLQANGSMLMFLFLSVLVNFAEVLTSMKLSHEYRGDKHKVMAVIQRKLNTLDKPWLLCLDNADETEVNTTVGDLCCLANVGGGKGGCW